MTESTGDNRAAIAEPNERTQVDKRRARRRRGKIESGSLAATAATMTPSKLLNKLASLSLVISSLSLVTFHNQQPVSAAHAARAAAPNAAEQPLLPWQLQQQQPRWQPQRGGAVDAMRTSVNASAGQATWPIGSHQRVADASTLRPAIGGRRQVDATSASILPPSTSTAATLSSSTLAGNVDTGDSDVVTAESSNDPADPAVSSSSSAAEDEAASEPEEPDSLDRRDDHESTGPETTGGDEAQPNDSPGQPEESAPATFEGIHVRPSRESATPTTTTSTTTTQATTTWRGGIPQPASTTLRGGGGTTTQSGANSRASPALTTTASTPVVQRRQQVVPASATAQPPVSRPAAATTFDVSMGADRMLIKPALSGGGGGDFSTRLLSSAPTPLADASGRGTSEPPQTQPSRSTFANFLSRSPASQPQATARPTAAITTTPTTAAAAAAMTPAAPEDEETSATDENSGMAPTNHELANESVTHHQHVPLVAHEAADQRERLMYPPLPGGGDRSGNSAAGSQQADHLQHEHPNQHQQHQAELAVASICYTPMSLFLVILVTIAITLIVCFCTLHLVRYLKRHHQFDLVANTKHFDHKHLSGASSSAGYLLQSGAGSGSSASIRAAYQAAAGGGAARLSPPLVESCGGATRLGTCMLHPFQRDDRCNKCLATSSCGPLAQTSVSSEPGGGGGTYAFRNPYFADELNMQQQQPRRSPSAGADNVRLAARESRQQAAASDPAAMPLGVELGGEHMHFIESHIASLHNRQVTSSVKELSSLNGDHRHQHLVAVAPQVVDLTSDEQRARVRAHPQEGDLVAVDLSGHDIIGLGFDVCGGGGSGGGNGLRDQGIFVGSVSAHGPASESGLIHAGDRIRCLNVAFECMTLRDARDILNCAAPYQMRLLLEKRMAGPSELRRMPSGSGAAHQKRLHASKGSRGCTLPAGGGAAAGKNPLETTRDYLKQLTGKLLGSRSDNASESESERTSPPAARVSHQVGSAGAAPAAPIGSRAARQQMHRLEPAAQAAPINETTISARVRETSPSAASSSRRSSLSGGAHESGAAQSHHRPREPAARHAESLVAQSTGRGHRRAESCHFNEAFRPDDDDDEEEDGNQNERDNGNDNRHESSATRRATTGPANCDGDYGHDNEPADRHLFEYDDRQNKLMASGQTFNSASTSRLTM